MYTLGFSFTSARQLFWCSANEGGARVVCQHPLNSKMCKSSRSVFLCELAVCGCCLTIAAKVSPHRTVKVEKEERCAMMEADRAVNLLEHQKEIHARPARQWIVSQQRKVRISQQLGAAISLQAFVTADSLLPFSGNLVPLPVVHPEVERNQVHLYTTMLHTAGPGSPPVDHVLLW